MSEHNKICGIREDKRTGQFVPQVDGKDISPTSFDPERAQSIAWQAANMPPDVTTLRAQRDRLREACEAACRAAADCLPPSGEGELDAMYYKAKLQAIDEAAAKCSAALKECEQ